MVIFFIKKLVTEKVQSQKASNKEMLVSFMLHEVHNRKYTDEKKIFLGKVLGGVFSISIKTYIARWGGKEEALGYLFLYICKNIHSHIYVRPVLYVHICNQNVSF